MKSIQSLFNSIPPEEFLSHIIKCETTLLLYHHGLYNIPHRQSISGQCHHLTIFTPCFVVVWYKKITHVLILSFIWAIYRVYIDQILLYTFPLCYGDYSAHFYTDNAYKEFIGESYLLNYTGKVKEPTHNQI